MEKVFSLLVVSSGRRPYVHERIELYCSSLYEYEHFLFLITDLCEKAPDRAFYSSRSGSYIETRGPTGGPEMVKTLYSI
jgi:hypothetical protein